MTLLRIPQKSSDYRLELLDGELLLFHPGQSTIIQCNVVASLIWQLCNGQRTMQKIITLLQNVYPEAQEVIAADVEIIVQQFAYCGAVEFT